MAKEQSIYLKDGSADWSGGINSVRTVTVQGPDTPNGLTRQQLAWLVNGTVRDAAMRPRDGFVYRGAFLGQSSFPYLLGQPYQGDFDYVPTTGTPYKICVVGGHVLKIDPTFAVAPVDLSEILDLTFPAPLAPRCYFCQGSQFLVIQAGDYNPVTNQGTLPFFWDGNNLTQSNGITGVTARGQVIADSTQVSVALAWSIPSPGNNVTINTSPATQQPLSNASLYDVVDVSVYEATTGPDGGADCGTYRVVGLAAGSITLECIANAGSGPFTTPGTNVPATDTPLVLTCTIQNPATQAVVLVQNALGQVSGAGNPKSPGNGDSLTLNFPFAPNGFTGSFVSSSVYYTINLWANGTDLGTYNVTAPNPANSQYQLVITGVNTQNVGTAVYGANVLTYLVISYTNPLSFPKTYNYLNIPEIGQTIVVPFNGNLPNGYTGSPGDIISVPGAGTFSVDTTRSPGNFLNPGGTPVVLTAVGPLNVGTPFPFSFTLTTTQAASTVGSNINQLPAAGPMAYYMGRLWYTLGQTVSAGDIVGGDSGTKAYNFTDSILCVTENPVALGGDGFTMPAGNDLITGLAIPQMINASLGQGLLYIGTPNWVFSLQVPVTRADWIAATSSNQPQVLVVQSGASTGFVNDISVIPINGDLWYKRPDGGIQSLLTAVRYFQQWANVLLSSNEDRITSVENLSLLNGISGVFFNNRMLMSALPQTTPFGIVSTAIIPLDLTTISTLEQQDPPNWEGQYEGLQVLKISTVTFGNTLRCFITMLSSQTAGQMEIWECVIGQSGDNNGQQTNRTQWQATLPSFDFGKLFELKELLQGELALDNLLGTVDFKVEFSPDASNCWYLWWNFRLCSAPNNTGFPNPDNYPVITYTPGKRKPVRLPKPPYYQDASDDRAANVGFEFQVRITVTGQCGIRGFRMFASERQLPLYSNVG